MKIRLVLGAAGLASILGAAPVCAQDPQKWDPQNGGWAASGSATTTTVTNVTGTISQLNYGSNGVVDGFLLGTNILLEFPMNVMGGIGTLGAARLVVNGQTIVIAGGHFGGRGGRR